MLQLKDEYAIWLSLYQWHHINTQYKREQWHGDRWWWKSSSSSSLLSYLPFYCFFFVILDIVCEAPSCLVSSARVQTRSCVNFGEQNWILGCTEGPPKICFQSSGFGHGTTKLSSFFPNYPNSNLLLIFPTIWKQIN